MNLFYLVVVCCFGIANSQIIQFCASPAGGCLSLPSRDCTSRGTFLGCRLNLLGTACEDKPECSSLRQKRTCGWRSITFDKASKMLPGCLGGGDINVCMTQRARIYEGLDLPTLCGAPPLPPAFTGTILPLVRDDTYELEYFVSPTIGVDATFVHGTRDDPFQSLAYAVERTEAFPASVSKHIVLLAGIHRLLNVVTLSTKHSNLVIEGEAGATVRGSNVLENAVWSAYDTNKLMTTISPRLARMLGPLSTLYVNGRAAVRARFPNLITTVANSYSGSGLKNWRTRAATGVPLTNQVQIPITPESKYGKFYSARGGNCAGQFVQDTSYFCNPYNEAQGGCPYSIPGKVTVTASVATALNAYSWSNETQSVYMHTFHPFKWGLWTFDLTRQATNSLPRALARTMDLSNLQAWQQFYLASGGDNWQSCGGVNAFYDPCATPCAVSQTSMFITCRRNSRNTMEITQIVLTNNRMQGKLNDLALQRLTSLTRLDLHSTPNAPSRNVLDAEPCVNLPQCVRGHIQCNLANTGVTLCTDSPTESPTASPSPFPTMSPTNLPSLAPSTSPVILLSTLAPTNTNSPTAPTTLSPTARVTKSPISNRPTQYPTLFGATVPPTSFTPTELPTASPLLRPTAATTLAPSQVEQRSIAPSSYPTFRPTQEPTLFPTVTATDRPSNERTTDRPSMERTTDRPTERTAQQTNEPTVRSDQPTQQTSFPTLRTGRPKTTKVPSIFPSPRPSLDPTKFPSQRPTTEPTLRPTSSPTQFPTVRPTTGPTLRPTLEPTQFPSVRPTSMPSHLPSVRPTLLPTMYPSERPTATRAPTNYPSILKSPTTLPVVDTGRLDNTFVPTFGPTLSPVTIAPSELPTTTESRRQLGTDLDLTLQRGGFQEARGDCGTGGGDWFVENSLTLLDYPGEFFLDIARLKLYYFPNTTIPANSLFELTTHRQLIQAVGNSVNDPIVNVKLINVIFEQTYATHMDDNAFEVPSGGDWTVTRQAAVIFENARNVLVNQCTFRNMGGNALFISKSANKVEISRNDFVQVDSSSVLLVGDPLFTTANAYDRIANSRNHVEEVIVRENVMSKLGGVVKQASGVFMAIAKSLLVERNVIFDCSRAGITWNDHFGGNTTVRENIVFDVVLETDDHGPMNMWDRQQWLEPSGKVATRISNNLVFGNDIGPKGIDLDDGVRDVNVTGNVILEGLIKLKGARINHSNNLLFPVSWACYLFTPLNLPDLGSGLTVFNNTCIPMTNVLPPFYFNVGSDDASKMCMLKNLVTGFNRYHGANPRFNACGRGLITSQVWQSSVGQDLTSVFTQATPTLDAELALISSWLSTWSIR